MTEYVTHHHLLEAGACADGVEDGIVELGRWWVRADEVPPFAAPWLYGGHCGDSDGYGPRSGGSGGYGCGYYGCGKGDDGYGSSDRYSTGNGDGYRDGYGYGDGNGGGYGGYSYGYGYSNGNGNGNGNGYGDGADDGESACADALVAAVGGEA